MSGGVGELQATIEGLRRDVAVRDNMISVMSHELRGPLNNIGLAMTLLETDDASLRATALGSVHRALARAERLLGDLVDLARILAPEFELDRRRVGARGLIDAAVLDEQSAAQAKRIEIVIDVPEDLGDVFADRDRVIQVLQNLLRDALAQAPESSRVTVEARVRGDDEIEFAVVDEGSAISPALRMQGLDRFWQAKNGSRTAPSDLGLAIAKAIVMAHGGEIGFEAIMINGAGHGDRSGARCWFTIQRPVPRAS